MTSEWTYAVFQVVLVIILLCVRYICIYISNVPDSCILKATQSLRVYAAARDRRVAILR